MYCIVAMFSINIMCVTCVCIVLLLCFLVTYMAPKKSAKLFKNKWAEKHIREKRSLLSNSKTLWRLGWPIGNRFNVYFFIQMTAAYGSQVEKSRPRKIKLVLQHRQLHMTACRLLGNICLWGEHLRKASVRNGS